MIAWFARNHVVANLLMIALLMLGLYALTNKIPVEVFPSLELDTVQIHIDLPGASPEEMEESVAIKVEEAVQDVEGIEQITSTSYENSAVVILEIDSDYDPSERLLEIQRRVDAINTFPVDIERPVLRLSQIKREVITVAVAGELSEREIRQVAEQVRDELLALPGITQVELSGTRAYELVIELKEQALRKYNLTIAEVATAIRNSSTNRTAGNIKTAGGEILVSTRGQAYDYSDFARIPIKSAESGGSLLLGDIANIVDGFEETPSRSRFNGKPAAFVEVYRIGNQSAITLANDVKRYVDNKNQTLPQTVTLETWRDRSLIVKKRLNTLSQSALQGGALVLILLTLFLRPQVAFWVFIGIPISFTGAFLFMALFGYSLNIISLFGFILVLGIVVDDAIVTGENIYTHQRRGSDPLQASIEGTQEIALPVTFGVLTTMAAFAPLLFIEGTRGKFFAQIPAVVIPILLFSLIESKLILPAHLKRSSQPKTQDNNSWLSSYINRFQMRFALGLETLIKQLYQPLLNHCLKFRYSYLMLFIGMLLILITLITQGWMRFTFFPKVPSEFAKATLSMPAGSNFEISDEYVRRITEAAQTLQQKYFELNNNSPLITHIQSITGGSRSRGSDTSSVTLELLPPEERSYQISSQALTKEWRALIGPLPGVEGLTFRAEIGHRGTPIDIQLKGQDLASLEMVSDALKDQLASYPTLFDISDSLQTGKEELQIELTDLAYTLGFTRSSIISQIRQIYHGIEIQRMQRGRDEIRVLIRHPLNERQSVMQLGETLVETPAGNKVPLLQLVDISFGTSPSSITRTDRYRTLNVYADLDKKNTNMVLLKAELETFLSDMVTQYPNVYYSMKGEIEEQEKSLASLAWGFILVLFAIYCLLAIPFKSYVQPIIVMSIIPFSIVGAILGHAIMQMNLTIMSIFGILALMGVVVNDSLVLVDFINRKVRSEKTPLLEAISTAGVARFRPVMLTSLTTFMGLLPLLFEKSTQAQFLIPMAVSLGFGILFATLLTLFLVPINYLVLNDIRALFSPRPLHERKEVSEV